MRKAPKRTTSPRFAERPRDVPSNVPLYAQIARPVTREITEVVSKDVKFTRYPAKHARNSRTWKNNGGFITVTGGNGLGIVPAAFRPAI
jgi:hypothetical protein